MTDDIVDASDASPPSSASLDAIALDRARRRRRLLVGGAVMVVLAGGGAFALFQYQDAKAAARVSTAWSSLSKCLLGAELEPGESASRRFRKLQLTAMTLPEAQRAAVAGQPWPQRCASLGHGLAEALHDAGRAEDGKQDLASFAEGLAKALKDRESYVTDLSESIENTWSAAKTEKVGMALVPDVAGPPALEHPLTVDALASADPLAKTSFSLRAVQFEPHAGRTLRLLVEEKGVPNAPFLCNFTGGPGPLSCAPLPPAIAETHQGLRLLGTADDTAAPLLFAGNRGADGVFRADTGEPVASMYSYGGYQAASGDSAVLGWNEAKSELRLVRKGNAKGSGRDEMALKPDFAVGNFYYSSQILWDQILLRGVTKKRERRLFAEHVDPGSRALGDPIDIGELPEPGLVTAGADEPPHIAGCRTGEALVVRVKGYDNDFMAFQIGGKWTQPVSPEITGGTLSCAKAEAVITRVEPSGADTAWKTSITQIRCTSAGCRGVTVPMEKVLGERLQFAPKDNHIDAVELDGKLLLVWAAGERGGVRMRFASADKITGAPDVVLFDDLVKDGKVQKLSSLFDLRLFSREGFAILLLGTTAGVHALRIDPDGKVSPAKVQWG